MATFRMKYVKAYEDRHGRKRFYYRRPGYPTVALPGEPGARVFADAYEAAGGKQPVQAKALRTTPGSMNALIAQYYITGDYRDLADITRSTYRNTLERFRQTFGDMAVREFTPTRIGEVLDAMADRPGARGNLRKVLNIVFKLAVRREMIAVNPLAGFRLPRKPVKGFRAWDDADIALFEKGWPAGSRERLALYLLLYTAQRRSDVVSMGRQHVKDGKIHVVQQKTGSRLWIALHPTLKAELGKVAKDQLTFVQTQYGVAFTSAGFGNWFGEAAKKAGLPEGCTAHGLRKAGARRLAEAGCTPHQIMAVTGHKNLSEVTLYTDAADQERLADEAIARTKVSNPGDPVRHSG